MKIVKTKYFENQLEKLNKKYRNIYKDISVFESDIPTEPFSDIGNWIYKYRVRNSSIPVGKRGGFRLIAKVYEDTFIPLIIYSKTQKENISDIEVIEALERVIEEL